MSGRTRAQRRDAPLDECVGAVGVAGVGHAAVLAFRAAQLVHSGLHGGRGRDALVDVALVVHGAERGHLQPSTS